MGEWCEGERKGQSRMNGDVGREGENGAGLDRWRSGVRDRRRDRTGWMREWGAGERRGQGWMDGRVG